MALDAIVRQSTYVTRTRPPRRGARVATDEFERLLNHQEQHSEDHDTDDQERATSDSSSKARSEQDQSVVVERRDTQNLQRPQARIEEGHIDEHV